MAKKKQRGNGNGTVYARKNNQGKIIGYRVVYYDASGKRRYVSAGNKTEGEKILRKLLADADRGLIFDAGRLRLGEYLEYWLTDCVEPLMEQGKIAHSTCVRYAGIVRNHIKPALGRRKVKDLNRAEVRKLYNRKAKKLSPRSVDYLHVTLQKALSQAVKDDLIPRNVATGERPRSSRDRDEIQALSPSRPEPYLRRLAESVMRLCIFSPFTLD